MKNDKTYIPKKREEYIACCRYYNGSDYNTLPVGDQNLGFYEQRWVEMHYTDDGVEELRQYIKDYKKYGLGRFSPDDGAPIALKALIWSRWMHWGSGYETPEDFKEWWKQFYLRIKQIDETI